jgi:hypothetical protein
LDPNTGRLSYLDQLTFVENGLSPAAETPFSRKPMPRRIRRRPPSLRKTGEKDAARSHARAHDMK